MPDLPDKLASAKEGDHYLDRAFENEVGNKFAPLAKCYTTSLDAIVSLIGEKLPANGGIDLFVRKGVSTAVIYHSEYGDGEWKASGKTIELAACRTLLRALQKGNGHE